MVLQSVADLAEKEASEAPEGITVMQKRYGISEYNTITLINNLNINGNYYVTTVVDHQYCLTSRYQFRHQVSKGSLLNF